MIHYTCDRPALKNIVGEHTDRRELPQKLPQYGTVIVYAFQQHCLISNGSSVCQQCLDSCCGFVGDFFGVIKLCYNINLFLLGIDAQKIGKFAVGGDSLGKDNRCSCPEADKV